MKKINKQDLEERMDYSIVSNRIKLYYEKVFNIEIIGLFYKNKMKKSDSKCFNKKNSKNLDNFKMLQAMAFDFHILIKDNNRKIFKYKLLKATYNGAKYREMQNKYLDLLEKIYLFVDETLLGYCQKKYLSKISNEKINDIIVRDKYINEDYKKWIIENYQ